MVTIMAILLHVAFVAVIGMTTVEAKGFDKVGTKVECGGSEVLAGFFPKIGDCAKACHGKSGMFIYGTNAFGTVRCHGGKCKCYCETATVHRCQKRIEHKGYDLYRFDGDGFKQIATKSECDFAETFKGYLPSAEKCAAACKGKAEMFIYGTNRNGEIRCKANGNCACYCETATEVQCIKRVKHNGYRLYRYKHQDAPLIG